ncbi:uncharacterized protein LOC143914038 [Arctopsyche grandis]|uniref:uncharacterized protein LOC143914038 n=1 Tax=Arctopsyche grandis TaxID=121162 RepID=UPI00406D7B63
MAFSLFRYNFNPTVKCQTHACLYSSLRAIPLIIMEARYTKECAAEMNEKLQYGLWSNVTSKLPHHVFLSHNLVQDVTADSIDKIYKPFNLKISPTKPISSVCSDVRNDPCMQLVTDKIDWLHSVTNMRTEYGKLPGRKKLATIQKAKTKTLLPMYLLDFAKLLREDPDPYFDSNYNWYLTGNGNLCSVIIKSIPYIIQSVDETLYVKKYHCNYDHIVECKYSCINKCLIYETICFSLSDSKAKIGLRQKYRIYLLDLKRRGDQMRLKLRNTVKSDIPLTSFAIDKLSNSVYFCCADGSIHKYNIELDSYEKLSTRNSQEKLVNLSSVIEVYNENNLLCTTGESISILDKRTCDLVEELSSYPKMNCEKFSISKFSSINENSIYVGTTHHLLKYDLRYVNDKNDLRNQWTHGLADPPIYLTNTVLNNEELIYLSCQSFSKFSLIVNECDPVNDEGLKNQRLTFPYTPPSVVDSLKSFQLKGHFLDPTLDMRLRLNMSRSGSMFLHHDEELHCLQLNCLGDLFSHRICDEDVEFREEDVYNCFQLWSNQLSGQNKNFRASSIGDMTWCQKEMARRYIPKLAKCQPSKDLLTSKTYWKDGIKEFQKCSDASAQELMSMWELDKMDVNMENTPVDTNFKVSDWLGENN